MNIIDSHIHICRCINGFGNSGEMQAIGGGYASYADGTIFQMIPECLGEYDVTPEAVLKVMDEAGVSKAVMLQGNFLGPQNLYTYEAAKKYPDRLAAAATYDPFCRNVDSIRKHLFEDLGIKIVKFEVSTGSGLMSYHPTIPLDGAFNIMDCVRIRVSGVFTLIRRKACKVEYNIVKRECLHSFKPDIFLTQSIILNAPSNLSEATDLCGEATCL